MTGMLCWFCGMEPLRSIDFSGGDRVVTFTHDCPVLAQQKLRVREAQRLASKNTERMASMELLLRETRDAVADMLKHRVWNGGQCGQLIDQPCTWKTPCLFHRVAALAKMELLERIDQEQDFQGTTFSAVLDAETCPACSEMDGKDGQPVPHPACTNPNGCRCSARGM